MRLALQRLLLVLGGACLTLAPWGGLSAQTGYVREELRIPMAAAGPAGLEALLVRPEGNGPFPLVLVNHGSPRDPADRPTMTPAQMTGRLTAFARRGFVAVAVMRRGYGASGGGWAEGLGPCSRPGYPAAAAAGVADLKAAIAALSTRPDVDAHHILAVGVSAGGFATVALTADPPPGLVAAVSFAGGRGSEAPDTVCSEDQLVSTFGALGARSRIPMLWVYAQNDHFFGPVLAERFKEAFVSAGGRVTFIKAQPFGEDGHLLFSDAGASVWEPMVDAFLCPQGLETAKVPLAAPALPQIAAPAGLRANGQAAFRSYLAAAPHKAFAMTPNGAFGWRSARRSDEEAVAAALASCAENAATGCKPLMINDQPAAK